MTKKETMEVLELFFQQCLRYWENYYRVSSDLDRRPFIGAIGDIPSRYPYSPNGELLDPEVVEDFRISRYLDCYGKLEYGRQYLADFPEKREALIAYQNRLRPLESEPER